MRRIIILIALIDIHYSGHGQQLKVNASIGHKDIINDANIHLSMAKTYSITKEWAAAISQFELALPNLPIDWNNYMLYGIACANSRNNSYY